MTMQVILLDSFIFIYFLHEGCDMNEEEEEEEGKT